MNDRGYHSAVGEAINVLIGGLTPFVERVMSSVLPPSVEWTGTAPRKDAVGGRRTGASTEVVTSPSCCVQ